MLTAEEKIRLILTGNPLGKPFFPHEGEEVTRWITGGTSPDVHATFHYQGEVIEVWCATCKAKLGEFSSHYGNSIWEELAAIRQSGHRHSNMEE